MSFRSAAVFVVCLIGFAPTGAIADVIHYDGGSPNRPTAIHDLTFANGQFDANWDYDTGFGTAVINPTGQLGNTTSEIATILLAALNTQGIDSNSTIAFFSVTSLFGPGFVGDEIRDDSVGIDDWRSIPGQFSFLVGASNPGTALITFTPATTTAAVPEPSSFAFLGLVAGGLVLRRRRKASATT